MLSYNNKREVQQGEDWNLDVLISQSSIEYIPFIISSQRVNPMFAITVASTRYEKNERYVQTWWQDLTTGLGYRINNKDVPIPRFYQTVPMDLGEMTENIPITRPQQDPPLYALYRYTLDTDEFDPNLGRKPYYYCYFAPDAPNEPRFDYECRIRMQFRSIDTSQWGSQNYLYQVTLVDTIDMNDYINDAHDIHPELDWIEWVQRDDPTWEKPIKEADETNEEYQERVEASWRLFRNIWISNNHVELFNFIKHRIPDWFQPDIDLGSPVGRIDVPQVILAPTEIAVMNNLRTII